MPRVTLGGIIVPDPLGAVVDVLLGDVWITDCTTVSTRSGKSLNMLSSWLSLISSSCTTTCSSSVSASDSLFVVSSHDHGLSIPDRQGGGGSTWDCEEEEGAGVLEGLEAGVGKDASAGNKSTSTFEEISTTTTLFLSASSHMYSASIRRISVEDERVTSISLVVSRGTPACRHNSVIRTGNGREVCFCLALMAISCEISSPRSMCLLDMIKPRQAAFGWRKMDSFWDGIMVLLIKLNQNLAAMLRSLFSIGASASIHLGMVSEIRGANQPFKKKVKI
ncbi:hypothetical protein H5410_047291 [Solanum commersonii]|uniref:Uncharacterized protein n=1 Tax=Solanum commersonii TaxID=4109 RepID=A0A9J5XEN6_SOLCO|nr:hypothetical protein H5410_047291 [Solanum commersonii]